MALTPCVRFPLCKTVFKFLIPAPHRSGGRRGSQVRPMAKKLSILDKTFQLALLLHRRTAEFNRKYKFTIGDRIDVVAEEAQEMILRANHQTDPKRAAQIIYDFVLRIDTLSLKLRMAVALGLMSDDAKAQCDMLIAKIKDEARGWRNYFLRGEGVVGKNNEPSAESL